MKQSSYLTAEETAELTRQGVFGAWLEKTFDFPAAVKSKVLRWQRVNRQPFGVQCLPVRSSRSLIPAGYEAALSRWTDTLKERLQIDSEGVGHVLACLLACLSRTDTARTSWRKAVFRLPSGGWGSVFVGNEEGVPFVRFWNAENRCSLTWPLVALPEPRALRKQPNRRAYGPRRTPRPPETRKQKPKNRGTDNDHNERQDNPHRRCQLGKD